MARFAVNGSLAVWDLGHLGELHRVAPRGRDSVCGHNWSTMRCPMQVEFVWCDSGRGDRVFCKAHGLETFPEARRNPDSGRLASDGSLDDGKLPAPKT